MRHHFFIDLVVSWGSLVKYALVVLRIHLHMDLGQNFR